MYVMPLGEGATVFVGGVGRGGCVLDVVVVVVVVLCIAVEVEEADEEEEAGCLNLLDVQ